MFRMTSGFVHSQVLLACVRIDLFTLLRDGPRPAADIAAQTGLAADRIEALLRAAAALNLLERRGADGFGLGMLGAGMVENEPVLAMVRHHELFYRDLVDPMPLFDGSATTTGLSKLWPYATAATPGSLDTAAVDAYTALMAASQAMVAEQVLAAFSLRPYGSMLDVGGGAGAFLSAVAKRWPHLELTLVDLPAVARLAEQRVADDGFADRIRVVGLDASEQELPAGHDVISLIRIIHDHDDARAVAILQAARAAMSRDGVLLIAEPMAGKRGAGALIDAYFSIYLQAMGSGRPRTFDQLGRLLREAGFSRVRRRRTQVPLITSVVVARP